MEFQTSKETATQSSSNGKYNYAAKLVHINADRSLKTLRGTDEILKDWKCVVREYTFISLRKCRNVEVLGCKRVR